VYRLENIERVEQPSILFAPPPDYTVRDDVPGVGVRKVLKIKEK